VAVLTWIEEEFLASAAKPCEREPPSTGRMRWGFAPIIRGSHAQFTRDAPGCSRHGQRFSCNSASAITIQGEFAFMVFQESFTVKEFLRFLRRLLRQNRGRKLYLIVDAHPVHRAKLVHVWMEKHAEAIRLIRLPGYSPELNPDDMLNQDVKSSALGRKPPTVLGDLIRSVRG